MALDNPLHIAVLLVILLLLFGAKRLPEMGRSLGSGLRGFKESINGETPVTAAQPAQATHLAAGSVGTTTSGQTGPPVAATTSDGSV
jgi:sec-independent protein translocase protein TatA